MGNLDIYDDLKKPPESALKRITGGRLAGFTDVNPQWRYQSMTKEFGPCGVGWRYDIEKIWSEPANDLIFAFAKVNLYIKVNEVWSEAIPGIGGSMLLSKETGGLHANDEGYKMAVTDALGTAMKMIGVAGDIYMGLLDGMKYNEETPKLSTKARNVNLLTASLQKLEKADPKWKHVVVAQRLQETYGAKGDSLKELLESLTPENYEKFAKIVAESLAKAGAG